MTKSHLLIGIIVSLTSSFSVVAGELDMKIFQDDRALYITIVNNSEETQTVNSRMSIGDDIANELHFDIKDEQGKNYPFCCKQRIFQADKQYYEEINPSSFIGKTVTFKRLKYLYQLESNKKYSINISYDSGLKDSFSRSINTNVLIPK